MRAFIIVAITSTAFLFAACSGSNGKAPTALVDEDGPNSSPGVVDDTTTPNPNPGGAPVDDGPGQTDPVAGSPDRPTDDSPVLPEPVPNLVDLPTPWGVDQPFVGSLLELDTFPRRDILSGGPGKDGIPALTNPRFVSPSEVSYLAPDDLVLGLVIKGEARAYPHNIGWWHEIVNDQIGGHSVCVTFCPLIGTGLVFDGDGEGENGRQFELGVSGLLYNNNLIMYDRRDGETLYPQIYFTGMEGPRTGQSLSLMPVVEITWATWTRLHPDTRVIQGGTYSTSRYTSYPYGSYRTNDDHLLFGLNPSPGSNLNPQASAYGAKDSMLGVRLNGEPMAYPFEAMGAQAVINHQVGGVDIAVVWDRDSYLAIPYARQVNGQSLTFDIEPSSGFPFNLRDRETGTLWDINGKAIEGELAGVALKQVPAHNSFWFAWVTFWQETGVWQP